jgi:glutathione S-transferase
MKLYMHPISVTSRPVVLFVAENKVKADQQVVNLAAGEHMQPAYAAINRSQLVPVLEDGDFRLTESSAILKYLADKFDLPSYPKDLKKRARVNEMMDWLNTQFYRDWGYGLCYPQIFPGHKRRSDEAQAATLESAKRNSERWLKVLNDWIGPKNAYLCGNEITIADYFGSILVSLGDAIRVDFNKYPNIARWLGNMRKLKSWDKVNEVFSGFAASLKDKRFETI